METFFDPDMFLPSEFSVQTILLDAGGTGTRHGTVDEVAVREGVIASEGQEDEEPTAISSDAITIRLVVSNSATTDWDLTGVIVWPVSRLLSWFVIHHKEEFQNKVVMEVGAGCGAVGMTAARYADKVILTDGQDLVIKMLSSTAKLEQFTSYQEQIRVLGTDSMEIHPHVDDTDEEDSTNESLKGMDSEKVVVQKLFWGSEESLEDFRKCGFPQADIVVGADVFHPSFGNPKLLFQTLVNLRSDKTKGLKFYVGFAERGVGNLELVLDAASSLGFSMTQHKLESFLPPKVALLEMSHRELSVLEFVLTGV